jgi:uncharacterized repeat protein (TIGR01451 family)
MVLATLFATIALAACMLVGKAHAAPPANTPIGNQASATYLDATATPRTVTSNLVTTIVQQVAGFTLTADGARTAAPGGQGVFPHVLTNTGNGTDTFPLVLVNLAGDDFDLTGLVLYADADGNGVPDNFTPVTTTGPLAAGATFRFVAVGSVPGTRVAGDVSRITVNAVSAFDGSQTALNTDQVTVSSNAVVNVTKSISASNGPSPSGPYTYTFTYTNSGNSIATNVALTDLLPPGMTYVPNSGRWSTTGASVLTDANLADAQGIAPNTIIYDFGVTGPNTVTAKIARVAPGASGTVTFQVNVNSGLAPQTINNFATFVYNDGVANVGPFTTNLAPFTVDLGLSDLHRPDGRVGAAGLDGLVHERPDEHGQQQRRVRRHREPGHVPGRLELQPVCSDGVTPLTDSNTNGIPTPARSPRAARTT